MYMAYYPTTARPTQTVYSFTSLFQSEWRPTDSSSIHPCPSFYWRRRLLDYSTFALGDIEVRQANTTAALESTLTAVSLVRGCFYRLRRIKTIRTFIPTSAAVILVNSFIVFRVDYYNSILAGLQTCQLNRIQSVLNSAARLITTDLLRDNLHWLRDPSGSLISCA